MTAVMISIRPKWVEKIASGEKTVEVRKTAPKLDTPFKCYIYCTKAVGHYWTALCHTVREDDLWKNDKGVIEFNDGFEYWGRDVLDKAHYLNGKVVGEFVCDRVDEYPYRYEFGYEISEDDFNATMLTADEFCGYGKRATIYGWHLSDLKIYDKPKALGEFRKPELPTGLRYEDDIITRPPQSWCYVEEIKA